MKKIVSLIALALLGATLCFGQDARGRVPSTVVSDVLAAMPCNDAATLAQNVQDLAVSAPATVELLAARLGERRAGHERARGICPVLPGRLRIRSGPCPV